MVLMPSRNVTDERFVSLNAFLAIEVTSYMVLSNFTFARIVASVMLFAGPSSTALWFAGFVAYLKLPLSARVKSPAGHLMI